jgi:hypothetical protein
MTLPQLTFSLLNLDSGFLGFQPRSVGGEVWVDNIKASSIDHFSYTGPPLPEVPYDAGALLTNWEVIGPMDRTEDDIAYHPENARRKWRSFDVDARGAVLSGTVTEFHGPKDIAYFRTRFSHDQDEEMCLHISTVNDLAMWVNGRFTWFVPRGDYAWFDFWNNPKHAGQRIPIVVRKGENQVVLRVQGGVYATGGFYARLEKLN